MTSRGRRRRLRRSRGLELALGLGAACARDVRVRSRPQENGRQCAGKRRQRPQLAGEPFLALPESAGALHAHWLATAQRSNPARIGAGVATPDESFEAVTNGLGVVLLSAGNAEI